MKQEEKTTIVSDMRKSGEVAKHTAKDSLFTDLFQIPKYLLQLYQALHPEDQDVTEKHIKNVTIKNVLLDQSYNDLGFQIGERLVVLVESQSSWTVNILARCLLYLAQTYQEYIERTKQSVYGSKKVELPKPELYVIYTGKRKTRPEYLSLSEEFFGGSESAIEVRVKMIYDGREGDIINQYVTFTRIYNEQIREHGRSREAVLETIRICKDLNVLSEYLSDREKEVVDIMMTLFDDEYILRTYVESEKKAAAQKAAQEAEEQNSKRIALKMYGKGNSVESIADILGKSVEDVERWVGLIPMV